MTRGENALQGRNVKVSAGAKAYVPTQLSITDLIDFCRSGSISEEVQRGLEKQRMVLWGVLQAGTQ